MDRQKITKLEISGTGCIRPARPEEKPHTGAFVKQHGRMVQALASMARPNSEQLTFVAPGISRCRS